MAFLLDTNVLSELRKGTRCDPKVRVWARASIGARYCVSVLTLGEIRKGIESLRRKDLKQCPAFERWLTRLRTDYERELLPITEEIVDRWGRLMTVRPLPVVDGLIAATALEHNLTVVTRNVGDFDGTDVNVVDPFA
jgi:predicted nucleic acid-binding protein